MLSTRPASPRLLLALAFSTLGALTSACADPSSSFDEFVARSPGPLPPGDCPEAYASPSPGEMDGPYFVTLLTSLGPATPLALKADIVTEAQSSGLGLGMTLQFLDMTDWRTPVGETIPVPPVPVGQDGKFTIELKGIHIPKEGNCVNHLDVSGDVTLMGNLCGTGSFLCGDITGHVVLDLTGTFTMQRITDEANYPHALLDCSQTEYTDMQCGPQ